MRFVVNGDTVDAHLSSREVERYGKEYLNEHSNISGNLTEFKLSEGSYVININGYEINVDVEQVNVELGHKVKVRANEYEFEIERIDEITRYNLFRQIIMDLKHII